MPKARTRVYDCMSHHWNSLPVAVKPCSGNVPAHLFGQQETWGPSSEIVGEVCASPCFLFLPWVEVLPDAAAASFLVSLGQMVAEESFLPYYLIVFIFDQTQITQSHTKFRRHTHNGPGQTRVFQRTALVWKGAQHSHATRSSHSQGRDGEKWRDGFSRRQASRFASIEIPILLGIFISSIKAVSNGIPSPLLVHLRWAPRHEGPGRSEGVPSVPVSWSIHSHWQ